MTTTNTERFPLPATIECGHLRISREGFLALEEIVRASDHYKVELAPRVAQELYDRGLIEFGRRGWIHLTDRFDTVFEIIGSTEPRDAHNARLVPNLPAWMDRAAAAAILAPFAVRA